MWKKSEFERYERVETRIYAKKKIYQHIENSFKKKLKLREILNELQNVFYKLRDDVTDLSANQTISVIKNWIESLNNQINEMRKLTVKNLLASIKR